MEIRDLYDVNRKLTGETIEKGQKVPLGRYYVTVIAFIENSDGKFLIQKRSKKEENDKSKWASTGGHVKSGETSKKGVQTEIKEEIGIDIDINKLELFKTIKTEDDFVDLYYVKENFKEEDMILEEDEVEIARWLSIDEIKDLIESKEFSESHAEFFHDCLEYLDRE